MTAKAKELIHMVYAIGGQLELVDGNLVAKCPRELMERLKRHLVEVKTELGARAANDDLLAKQGPRASDEILDEFAQRKIAFSEPVKPVLDLGDYEERAAIREYDGGLSRPEAEQAAAQDQGFDGADHLNRAAVAEWLDRLERMAGNDPNVQRLIKLTRRHGLECAKAGRDSVALFGIDPHVPRPETQRRDRWGLFVGMVWGIHQLRLVEINRNEATLKTQTGATEREPRHKAGRDDAKPIWETIQ